MMEINIEKVLKSKLAPSEYCILQCLFLKDFQLLEEFLKETDLFNYTNDNTFLGILKHLELRGWLKITVHGDFKFEDIILRVKAEKLFDNITPTSDNDYLKCFTIFPIKVPNGNGGYRVLKTKSTDSEDYKKGLKLWNDILKKDDGETVIKALEKQLELTRSSLQYTQNWMTWLRQKTYQKYKDIDEKNKEETTEGI
jgi:hypothetical protein